jgi:hypothetical protein
MPTLTSPRNWLIVALICACGWLIIKTLPPGTPLRSVVAAQESQPQGTFSPAHSSVRAAISEFLNRHPAQPAQPIAFPHKVHIARGLQCQVCHTGVDQGPDAAIPSVKFCMSCHLVIAKDRPGARRRHSLGASLRLQRFGSREVQPRPAHTGQCGVLELPWRYAAANDGGAGG